MSKKICLCRSVRLTLGACRALGLFPLSWQHKNGQCHYKSSYFWIFYSLVCCGLNIAHFTTIYDDVARPFQQDRRLLLDYVSKLTENITVTYNIVFILVNIYKSKRMAKIFNDCVDMQKDDLLCSASLKAYHKLHIMFMIGIVFQNICLYSAIFLLNTMSNYDTDWSYRRFLFPFYIVTPLIFYALYGSTCTLIVTTLGCYENKLAKSLGYQKVHPLEELDETKNYRQILFFRYELCPGNHKAYNSLQGEELIEYFKALYDKVKLNLVLLNQCFDPQCLIHMTVELINLVFNYFSVIIYFSYKEITPENATLNFFNWVYVIVHTLGLFVFLMTANHLEITIKRLIYILLEYSTRVSNPDLDQQIRVFLRKLQNQQPLTANGIFTVNKSIVVPMCANVLMYVLVAVQFDFPKIKHFDFNVTTPME